METITGRRKSAPSATLSTTNHTWTTLRLNLVLHDEKQAISDLSNRKCPHTFSVNRRQSLVKIKENIIPNVRFNDTITTLMLTEAQVCSLPNYKVGEDDLLFVAHGKDPEHLWNDSCNRTLSKMRVVCGCNEACLDTRLCETVHAHENTLQTGEMIRHALKDISSTLKSKSYFLAWCKACDVYLYDLLFSREIGNTA